MAVGLLLRSIALATQADIINELELGQHDLVTAKAQIKQANADRSLKRLQAAVASLAQARRHFQTAETELTNNILLRLADGLPLPSSAVRSRIETAMDVSKMGVALADAGTQAGAVDGLLIKPSGPESGLSALLPVLDNLTPTIAPLRAALVRAESAASRVNSALLPPSQRQTFIDTRATLRNTVAAVDEFERLAPVLKDILGGNGPRTYLVEQVNPSELRSGGGFLGTLSVLHFDAGKVQLAFSGDITQFESSRRPDIGAPGYVAPPHALNFFYSGQTWWMEDSNFSPDFPSNARSAEFFSNKDRRLSAQGVIALDYYAVASLIDVTGPISVPQFGITFTSQNFVAEVLKHDLAQDSVRKSILSAAAQPLLARIVSLPPDRWATLINSLNSSAKSRHLQAYFDSPTAEAEIDRFGWSGTMNATKVSDFVMETEDNYGGTKANQFVSRSFAITLTHQGNLLHHKIVLRVEDHPPAITVPYGFHYYFYLRFYVPTQATSLSLKPDPGRFRTKIPPWDSNTDVPAGYKLADGWAYIDVAPGQTSYAQLEVDYDTPWSLDTRGSHILYMQKQPGTTSNDLTVTWQTGRTTYNARAALDQDQVITLSPNSLAIQPGQVATATLPGLSF